MGKKKIERTFFQKSLIVGGSLAMFLGIGVVAWDYYMYLEGLKLQKDMAAFELPDVVVDGVVGRGDYEILNIDHDYYRSLNSEYVGYFDMPFSNLSEPMPQPSYDESDYIYKNFKGGYDRLGAVFASMNNNRELTNSNVVLYGHMATYIGRVKFGNILSFADDVYYIENPYYYIYVDGEESPRKILVLDSVVIPNIFDEVSLTAGHKTLEELVPDYEQLGLDRGLELVGDDRVYSLITCERPEPGIESRLIVYGVEVPLDFELGVEADTNS